MNLSVEQERIVESGCDLEAVRREILRQPESLNGFYDVWGHRYYWDWLDQHFGRLPRLIGPSSP